MCNYKQILHDIKVSVEISLKYILVYHKYIVSVCSTR